MRAGGAGERGVFWDGRPVPYEKVGGAERIRRKVIGDREIVLHTSSVTAFAAPVQQWDIAVESKVAGVLQSAANLKIT